MYKYVLFLISLPIILSANQTKYAKGLEYFNQGDYKKAFPVMKQEAKSDNRAAQYRLGVMYSQGLGVKKNNEKAVYWLTKSNEDHFGYINIPHTKQAKQKNQKSNNGFLDTITEQTETTLKVKEGREYFFSKINKDTTETKRLFDAVMSGDTFGIVPYRTNYFLPLSYSKDKPVRLYPTAVSNGAPQTYNENMEVEFQLSLQKMLTYDLFGLNEYIFAAYTQKVWWQLYDKSGPFRETNYEPEIFTIIPTSNAIDDATGLKGVKAGFVHESNGQEGYRSRSWNRLYLAGLWQWGNLFASTRVWYRIDEDRKPNIYYEGGITEPEFIIAHSDGDDNPDIEDYLGYGDIKLNYLYGKSKLGLLLRNNFNTGKGAIEMNYAYPILNSSNSFFYIKLFKGYGQSLAEYNKNVTKAAFGISFSTEIF